jgi:hypothetical protein
MALHAKLKQQAQLTTQVFNALSNTLQNKENFKISPHGKTSGKQPQQ